MKKINILTGYLICHFIFLNVGDVQARQNSLDQQKQNSAMACDFIYARYYEAISYAQDMLDSAKTISQAGSREMQVLENNGAKIHFSKSGHKILILSLELSPEYLENNGISSGLLKRLGLSTMKKSEQYKVNCENDEAILDVRNGKISKVSIKPNFID